MGNGLFSIHTRSGAAGSVVSMTLCSKNLILNICQAMEVNFGQQIISQLVMQSGVCGIVVCFTVDIPTRMHARA